MGKLKSIAASRLAVLAITIIVLGASPAWAILRMSVFPSREVVVSFTRPLEIRYTPRGD